MTIYNFTTNLMLASLLGCLIGLERQWRQRMAGLRTNALVSLGAAIFIMTIGSLEDKHEVPRMAAQIISGIGFLGAGVIMRDGVNIRGLNTAATIWCSAGIGILCGLQLHLQAAIAAMFIVCTNVLLRPVAMRLNHLPHEQVEQSIKYQIQITCRGREEIHIRQLVLHSVQSTAIVLRSIHSEEIEGCQKIRVIAELESQIKNPSLLEQIVSRISLEKGVTAANWLIQV
ncbi:MAG: MgtC/SapB family protein [Pseudobdellovibrionaceae bacterium]